MRLFGVTVSSDLLMHGWFCCIGFHFVSISPNVGLGRTSLKQGNLRQNFAPDATTRPAASHAMMWLAFSCTPAVKKSIQAILLRFLPSALCGPLCEDTWRHPKTETTWRIALSTAWAETHPQLTCT